MTHQIKNRGTRGDSSRDLAGKPALNEKPLPQLQSSRWLELVTALMNRKKVAFIVRAFDATVEVMDRCLWPMMPYSLKC